MKSFQTRSHLNKLWIVLGAIVELKPATLKTIHEATGLPQSTINDILKKLVDGQVAGVVVTKNAAEYEIDSWPDFREKVIYLYNENRDYVNAIGSK